MYVLQLTRQYILFFCPPSLIPTQASPLTPHTNQKFIEPAVGPRRRVDDTIFIFYFDIRSTPNTRIALERGAGRTRPHNIMGSILNTNRKSSSRQGMQVTHANANTNPRPRPHQPSNYIHHNGQKHILFITITICGAQYNCLMASLKKYHQLNAFQCNYCVGMRPPPSLSSSPSPLWHAPNGI